MIQIFLNYGEGFLPAVEQLIEYENGEPREVNYEGNTYRFVPGPHQHVTEIQHERVEFPNLVWNWDGTIDMVQPQTQPRPQQIQLTGWRRFRQCATRLMQHQHI